MKKIAILLTAVLTMWSCANSTKTGEQPTERHMSFMGMHIDGTLSDFLNQVNPGFKSDSLFGNLELRIDSITSKSFICSQGGKGISENNIWFEFFFFAEPNGKIVGLQGWSIMSQQMYEVLRVSLIESLGSPLYDKNSLTPELMYELDVHEAMVYNDLESNYFEIWKLQDGYVILQSTPAKNSKNYDIELDIVDKVNFDRYIDDQLANQN